ncbi:sensor histidine kinase [Gordonia hydrophobica]|uniref:ATP-binding protein n=1 Tax=Gordonia hydrophobica TaxID=40516 RepID=A0ABZ2TWL4_9ACTN|nr:ATP-binding protein [Gordonia hydrophobica]MBM7369279.1 signal transduction histidine kinase [Gordonia hydrophobica]
MADFVSLTAEWWPWLSAIVIVAIAVVLIAIGISRDTDRLAPVAYLSASAYVAVVLMWFIGWNGTTVPASGARLELWVIFIPQIIGCVLVMAGCLTSAVAMVLVGGGVSLGVAATASGQWQWIDVVQAAWLLALTCLYQVIAWAVMAGARRFDDHRDAAAAEAVNRLHHEARGAEQRRLDAMLHDRLISLLLALRPGPVTPAGAKAITEVLDEIAEWRLGGTPARTRVPATDLVQRLRLAVDELGDDVETVIVGDTDADYPAEAADAIIDAACEAVRNVHRHAGQAAACAVVCEVRDDSISALVIDDGIGFEPQTVPANRIGVAFGIIERMDAVDGGRSRLDSAPGSGTRVELSWTAPGRAR